MRIAVTGGNGFIGRATIAAAVRAGHTAWSFDRAAGQDVLGDLDELILHGMWPPTHPDVVIHLAGMLGTDELFDTAEEAVHANVIGTLRVLEWCHNHGVRYVGITMPPVFPSVYTATKICATRLATAWHLSKGLPVSHVRAFNAYGPHQAHGHGHPQKILPTFARCAWEGQPIPIWGGGEQIVDLVHADDVGRMLVEAAAQGGDDETFDAGTGQPVTVNELARRVLGWTGSKAGVEYLPMRRGETASALSAATGEGWDLLDWKPELDWDRVEAAVEWYR
jgi:UDP-glucose 4-epimerase